MAKPTGKDNKTDTDTDKVITDFVKGLSEEQRMLVILKPTR